MTDFTRRSNSAREMERVAIVAVDPASRTATGITRIRTSIQINCAFATGDTITTPAVGEQWYVERLDYEWRLYGRIPFNDATLNIEPEEGQVSVGAATGPLELNGTEVRANGRVFRLNGVYYRDSGETLERSEDGEIWEPIRGTTAGVIQLIANALAGVPGTEAILDLLSRLTDDENQALQALRDWAEGLGPGGDGWAPLCDNPFFASLRSLGTGEEPLDQIVSGFQAFINNLWGLLFCGFDGELTATDALAGIGGVTGLLGDNPLIQGLADLLGDGATGNLLFDAVGGVSAFLQQLVDALFCNLDGDITPQGILGAVADLLGPLQNNPFILGLQALAEALDVSVGNLFTDAVNGATEFLQQLIDLLFCNFTGDLTPQNILSHIGDLLEPLINNPFIQGLQSLAEFLGTAVGNLFADAINGATGLLEGVFRLFFCDFTGDLTPQGILEHVGDLLEPLTNNPFVQGLATLAQTLGTGVGSLLGDAINGAFGLLDGVFRAVFCDFDGDLTPQDIIGHIGDLLEPLRTNPFIVGLGELATVFGTGIGNLAADAVNGAVGLLQAVFGAIFCDFSGTFTPQAMLTKLTDVLGSITANPFIAGLIDFAEGLGHTLGGGIEKAFAGANELLEAIFGIFFCDNEGVPTPQLIVDSISDIMDFLRTNPLIEGLVDFITDVGTSSTGFLRKALEGGFEFFNQIVNALFCNLPGQPTPTAILASLAGIIESVTDNPYVQMLRALADALGDTSTNLIQQLLAGVTGIFDWFIDLLNTLLPFFDWNDIKTLNFPSMMADLLDNLNPLAFLGPDGLLPLNKLPALAINTLTGITTFLQNEIFGPLQDAILGGLNTTLTGGLAAINEFFDGALGAGGSLLQQIVNAMTGVGTFASGPLATIRSLFSGITLGGGNLISQITGTLDEFVSNLDIAAMVSRITGININDLPTDPLDALSQFFSGFSAFTGTNTLLSQVLSQAGSNLKPLVSAITGIAENAITDVVATATSYFANFRALFNFNFGAGFNLAAARDALVGVLNNATAGLLNGSLIGSLGINQVSNLVRFITGKTTGGVPTDIEAMFTNLRGMFTSGGTFTLLPGGVFNIAAAANAFITNVLSQATSAIGSVKIPALAIADLGINQISNLISTLTGGATLTEFSNFFANLRTFFGIGSGTGLINLLVAPGSFNLVAALNSFISNVLSQATQALSAVLIPDLAITKITNLVPFLTGKTTGFSAADLDVFFANLRRMFNIGSGAGQINLTVTQTVETLQSALFGVVSTINNGVKTFLTQSGLNAWLGGGLNLTEIGNFFTNLTSFFKIADFKVAPATFAANLATVAGKFINDVINVATGVLINPLKVLGVGGTGTLSTDLGDAQKLSVKNAAELTKLQASQTAIGTGLQNFENFDYNSTTLLATKWSTVTESPNAGYYRTDGSRAYWADQGGSANTWWGRFLTPTKTPFQNVSVVLDSPLTESPILGSGEAYLYLLGRADATMSNYVYARIGVNTLSVWKKVAGHSPIRVGNAINYTVRVGDTVTFVCGTGVESSKIRQFQIIVNGIKQLDFTDSTFYGNVLSVMSTLADTTNPNPPQTNNFGGFGGYSAPRPGGGQSTPGAVSIFSISDNPVTPTVGSGIRVYRSNSAVRGSISSGDNIFPLGWFGAVDRITPDLTYDSQTGRVTVSVEGWYQCTIAQHGDSSIGPGGGGAARAMLWKGSGTGARQAVAIGPGFAWNINVGFSGFGGDFQVYLKAGEWVEPGYSCNAAGSNLLIADAAGLRTWFSMSLTNRSYA